jgi:hypothetical protein
MKFAHLFHGCDDTADIARGRAGTRLTGRGLRNAARGDDQKAEGYAQGDTHTRRPAPLEKGLVRSMHAGMLACTGSAGGVAAARASETWRGCQALYRLCFKLSLLAREPIVRLIGRPRERSAGTAA